MKGKKVLDWMAHIKNRIIVDDNNCWIWTGYIKPSGYGQIRIRNKSIHVHRLMWELIYGHVPEGIFVCHYCDIKSCCNPEHLFIGTAKDNNHDAALKGRTNRGEKKHCAKLTEEKVTKIRNDTRLQREIAENNGISQSAVSLVKTRKSWAWL